MNLFKLIDFFVRVTDVFINKKSKIWCFPSLQTGNWDTNSEALLHHIMVTRYNIKNNITIIRIQLNNSKDLLSDNSIPIFYAYSWKGILALMRAGTIFIHHGTGDLGPVKLCRTKHRRIINLWHGVNIKGIMFSDCKNHTKSQERLLKKECEAYTQLIASSDIHRQSLSCSFLIPYRKIKITGLPRNDILLSDNNMLSPVQLEENKKIKELTSGKKIILYAPTFRNNRSGFFDFSEQQYLKIKEVIEKNNFTIAYRQHINTSYLPELTKTYLIDLSSDIIQDTQIVLRNTHLLITDYSGIWIDYLLLNRPVICFCYDLEDYINERGLLYDYENIFPGEIIKTPEKLISKIEILIKNYTNLSPKHYWCKKLFHKFEDNHSCDRLLNTIDPHSQVRNEEYGLLDIS